jgi:hypothetical protein
MTRRCAWCEKILGEKCPFCGLEAKAGDVEGLHFSCFCAAVFEKGQGGTTHTICDDCAAKTTVILAENGERKPGEYRIDPFSIR